MLPLRTTTSFEPDPLISLIATLSELKEKECGLVQILFQKTKHNWQTEIIRALTDQYGKPFFTNKPDLLPLAKQKTAQPLYAVVIRVGAKSSTIESARQIAKRIESAFEQFTNPSGNQLVPLSNQGYEKGNHENDILTRTSRRSGMLLNGSELISFIHPPSASVKSAKLMRQYKKTKAAPDIVISHKLILGENTHRGITKQVSLSSSHRARHTFILGKSGTGKSTHILNIILQDIENKIGVAVFDPHGDAIDNILGRIPKERYNDVILFDPSDENYPVSFNVICANSDLERTLLESDMVATFKRFSTSFGDQMVAVLGNAIQALLLSEQGGTLLDLKRFLAEPRFRKEFLKTVKDEDVVYYFEREFPLLHGNPQGPVLTRLNIFLRQKLIRNIVAQKENRLDFRAIMDERKIFLAKLSQGLIGNENAFLLGSLLVSKFYQTALSRQNVDESQRAEFQISIDEAHNFLTPSLSSILSGTRKYAVGITLATQDFRVLWNKDTDVASSLLTNACCRICFGLGDFDAQKLADGFSSFESSDLQNLGVGEAVCRVERNEFDFNLTTFPLPQVDEKIARERREKIVALSRAKYSCKREDVERELSQKRQAIANGSLEEKQERTQKSSNSVDTPHNLSLQVTESDVGTLPDASNSESIEPLILEPPDRVSKDQPKQGCGGAQHQFLQNLVKRIAEGGGYRVTIEQPVLGGKGKVDVSLERDDLKIACEISVTTPGEYEVGNIQKCLTAGYKPVIVISASEKHLENIKQRTKAVLSADDLNNVVFLQPDSFHAYLESLSSTSGSTDGKIKGFKVNVSYKESNETEINLRTQALAEIISKARKRRKS